MSSFFHRSLSGSRISSLIDRWSVENHADVTFESNLENPVFIAFKMFFNSCHYTGITIKFQLLRLIFNISQRTVSLSGVLKIMWRNWNIIVMLESCWKWFICFKMNFKFQHMIFNTYWMTYWIQSACRERLFACLSIKLNVTSRSLWAPSSLRLFLCPINFYSKLNKYYIINTEEKVLAIQVIP